MVLMLTPKSQIECLVTVQIAFSFFVSAVYAFRIADQFGEVKWFYVINCEGRIASVPLIAHRGLLIR